MANFPPGSVQERAQNHRAAGEAAAARHGQSASALQQAHEHRLRLIVLVMAEQQQVAGAKQFVEGAVAGAPRRGLQIAARNLCAAA